MRQFIPFQGPLHHRGRVVVSLRICSLDAGGLMLTSLNDLDQSRSTRPELTCGAPIKVPVSRNVH